MNCIVTAGPTFESLDEVRRLTNFSTGRLGSELANHLVASGHRVTLLRGQCATHQGPQRAQKTHEFTTTDHLRQLLEKLASPRVNAVFHAAAVSDFKFGKIWERRADGSMIQCRAGKISTRAGTLLAELVPTTKLIAGLRSWYPRAAIVGWKYEVEGNRTGVVALALEQIVQNQTDACVANGPAYGRGFGVVTSEGRVQHRANATSLYHALARLAFPRR